MTSAVSRMAYDPLQAKFRASLRWLFGVAERAEGGVVLATQEEVVAVEHPFIIVQRRVEVRPDIIEHLTQGHIYCSACHAIFSHQLDRKPSQLCEVIQTLARRGFYVSVDEEEEVNEDVLCQAHPFSEASHVALMDTLMAAHTAQVVSIEQVVQIVKSFGSFNASRELPFDVEDALLLWVNKVCHFVVKQHINVSRSDESKKLAARQRRRVRVKAEKELQVPFMDDLVKDMRDGRCLGVLTSFYLPDALTLAALKLSDDLTEENIRRNVQLVKEALETTFSSLSFPFPLSVNDIVESSLILKQNIVTLVAHLFEWFERKHSTKSGEQLPQVESHDKLFDETANQLPVAESHHESKSLQQAAGCNSESEDTADGQQPNREKPPLPSRNALPLTKHQDHVIRQENDSQLDSVYEKSIDQASPCLSTNADVAGGVALSHFGHVHEDSHPAHWKHVPLKRGRWMSRSLDSFQRGLAVGTSREIGSEDTNGDYNGPSPITTTWRQQHHAVSHTQRGILNETFSYNHDTNREPVDGHTNGSDGVAKHDEAQVVENQVEVIPEDCEIIQLDTVVAMSNDVKGEEGQMSSGSPNELHQESRGEDQDCYIREQTAAKESIDLHHPTSDTDSDEQRTHPHLRQCQSQVETEKHAPDTQPQSLLPNQQLEHCHSTGDNSTHQQSPELLLLRLKLEEKRRAIEQERHQLEALWEEHRRQVGEAALLEALRRAKSGTPSRSEKPSPLVSHKRGIGHRNRWLEGGHGQVGGKKQEQDDNASYKLYPAESVPAAVSALSALQREGSPVQQGNDNEAACLHVVAAGDASQAISKPNIHEVLNCAGFVLSETSSHTQGHMVGSPPAVEPCVSSSSLMSTQSADTHQHSQVRQGSKEGLPGDKPIGFFVDGWGSDDNKISTAELERRKAKLLQARQKQLADGKAKRQAEAEKRKEHARMKVRQEEKLREEKEQEQVRLKEEQRAKELAEAEIHRLTEERRKAVFMGLSSQRTRQQDPEGAGHTHLDQQAGRQPMHMVGSWKDGLGMKAHAGTTGESSAAVAVVEAAGGQSKLATRSNRQLIQNAIRHVCLAGGVNKELQEQVIQALEQSEAAHFLILFRDGSGKKFRALYSYDPVAEQLLRLCGRGPRVVSSEIIDELYKYNSGSKAFQLIQSRTVSLSVDAFTIDSQLWQTKRGKSARKM